MAEELIRVALVEDDPLIRSTLALILDGSPGYECKQVYGDCESAIPGILADAPDVVLMDIGLPGMSGVEGTRILKETSAEIDIVMLTIQVDDESIFGALSAGATGYLVKDTPPAVLLQSIREVKAGGSPMSSGIARKVVGSFQASIVSPLSSRETEILQLLCDGENYRSIADRLFISGHTVRSHIKNIYEKLHVNSRAQAVNKAFRDKLI